MKLKPNKKEIIVTALEYDKDPGPWIRKAAKGTSVRVMDEKGETVMVLSSVEKED